MNAPLLDALPLAALPDALLVGSLGEFDPADWDAVESAFAGGARCELGQAWRDAPEAGFQPGSARLGWRDESLWIYAVLRDVDVFNAATEPNQATWTTGDVFEIFLRPWGQNAYFELHVTPENQTLQLRFPDAKAVDSGRSWREFIVSHRLFSSRTLVKNGQWRVLAEIPALEMGENPALGQEWAFSLSRYDATRGQDKPVISSSSPHRVPRFHRQEEWRNLILKSKEKL